jgi:hypothetical protein
MKDRINFLKLLGIIVSAVIFVIFLDFTLTAALESWSPAL